MLSVYSSYYTMDNLHLHTSSVILRQLFYRFLFKKVVIFEFVDTLRRSTSRKTVDPKYGRLNDSIEIFSRKENSMELFNMCMPISQEQLQRI